MVLYSTMNILVVAMLAATSPFQAVYAAPTGSPSNHSAILIHGHELKSSPHYAVTPASTTANRIKLSDAINDTKSINDNDSTTQLNKYAGHDTSITTTAEQEQQSTEQLEKRWIPDFPSWDKGIEFNMYPPDLWELPPQNSCDEFCVAEGGG